MQVHCRKMKNIYGCLIDNRLYDTILTYSWFYWRNHKSLIIIIIIKKHHIHTKDFPIDPTFKYSIRIPTL